MSIIPKKPAPVPPGPAPAPWPATVIIVVVVVAATVLVLTGHAVGVALAVVGGACVAAVDAVRRLVPILRGLS